MTSPSPQPRTDGPYVVVVGAGAIGLTTAVRLLEAGARVLVRTAGAPLGTASAIAGAMIGPVFGDPADPVLGWLRASDAVFRRLANEPTSGVSIRSGRLLWAADPGDELPPWAPTVPGFRPLSGDIDRSDELPPGFTTGTRAELPFADMPVYLAWLTDRVGRLGGRVELSPVRSLEDAGRGADVVVNCAGLAAAELAGDPSMTPIRGQHVIVDAPWLTDFVYQLGGGEAWVGVMPHGRRVVLGGVRQPGNTDLVPDPAVTRGILERCIAAVPGLADSPVVGVEVGIRPGRPSVRVEREGGGVAGGVVHSGVVHNYGHAGNGVMLSWGCADAATALALGRTGGNPDAV
ncbi:NAD(P)/FAD-dependent oxidoreductase [Nakamurella sp. GG22]